MLIVAASLFLLKPSLTGFVVVAEEKTYSDNLNLKINESGTYEWQVKNPGNMKSIKVTGSIGGNGTAKIYIEKGGKRDLIYKNK